MAEVVYNSLQYLSDGDIRAMAVYLKSLAEGSPPSAAATSIPTAESSLLLSLGKTVYDSQMRELPWRGWVGQAAAISASRGKSIH